MGDVKWKYKDCIKYKILNKINKINGVINILYLFCYIV